MAGRNARRGWCRVCTLRSVHTISPSSRRRKVTTSRWRSSWRGRCPMTWPRSGPNRAPRWSRAGCRGARRLDAGAADRRAFFAVPVINALLLPLRPLTAKLPITPDASWNPGVLSSEHQEFGRNCGNCHEIPFVHVRDHACLACHREHARPCRDPWRCNSGCLTARAARIVMPITRARLRPGAPRCGALRELSWRPEAARPRYDARRRHRLRGGPSAVQADDLAGTGCAQRDPGGADRKGAPDREFAPEVPPRYASEVAACAVPPGARRSTCASCHVADAADIVRGRFTWSRHASSAIPWSSSLRPNAAAGGARLDGAHTVDDIGARDVDHDQILCKHRAQRYSRRRRRSRRHPSGPAEVHRRGDQRSTAATAKRLGKGQGATGFRRPVRKARLHRVSRGRQDHDRWGEGDAGGDVDGCADPRCGVVAAQGALRSRQATASATSPARIATRSRASRACIRTPTSPFPTSAKCRECHGGNAPAAGRFASTCVSCHGFHLPGHPPFGALAAATPAAAR